MNEIYPVIILKSRYGGTYEGADWIAFNADYEDLKGVDDGDCECVEFFRKINASKMINCFKEIILCGRGATPQEAYDDLVKKYYNK
jgi:hypothetical protein